MFQMIRLANNRYGKEATKEILYQMVTNYHDLWIERLKNLYESSKIDIFPWRAIAIIEIKRDFEKTNYPYPKWIERFIREKTMQELSGETKGKKKNELNPIIDLKILRYVTICKVKEIPLSESGAFFDVAEQLKTEGYLKPTSPQGVRKRYYDLVNRFFKNNDMLNSYENNIKFQNWVLEDKPLK